MADKTEVLALRDFYDRRAGKARCKGERFEATAARIAELNACGPEQGSAPLVGQAPATARQPKGRNGR